MDFEKLDEIRKFWKDDANANAPGLEDVLFLLSYIDSLDEALRTTKFDYFELRRLYMNTKKEK